MYRAARTVLVAIVAAVAMLALPAQAHVGDHPHVPVPVFKSVDHVAVEVGPAVADGWNVNAVVLNVDNRLGPPPDFHINANCEAHPNWGCIEFRQINTTQADPYLLSSWDNENDTAWVRFNVAGDWNPTQAGTCNGFLSVLRVHDHTESVGCRRQGYDTGDTLPSENEMDALRDAYRRS